LAGAAQDAVLKPNVSKEPLTAEQIAVYRALLEDYTKGRDGGLNLASKTAPFEMSGPSYEE
jgi:hypothetical protein